MRPMRCSVALDRFLGSCVTRVVPPWSPVCVSVYPLVSDDNHLVTDSAVY